MSNMDELLEFLRDPASNVTPSDFAYARKSPETRNRHAVGSERVPITTIDAGYITISGEEGIDSFYVRLDRGLGRFVNLEAIATDLAHLLERRLGTHEEFAPGAEEDFDECGEYIGITRSFAIGNSSYVFRVKVREHEVLVDVKEDATDKLSFDKAKMEHIAGEIALISQGYSRKYVDSPCPPK